jgi:capsular polysaccharide biosynthesis protein
MKFYPGGIKLNHTLENINVMDILFMLKKHLKFIFVCSILFGLISFLFSQFLISPKYQATATLIVNSGKNNETVQNSDQLVMSQKLVITYAIIMKSDPVLEKVIKDLGLKTSAGTLSKNIDISPIGTTEVMQMTVTDKNPENAALIANDITKVAPDVIISTVNAGSVAIISHAKVNSNKVSPNVKLNIFLAVFLGIIFGVLYAIIRESLDNTFKSDEDIQKVLSLTVIGVIPTVEENK